MRKNANPELPVVVAGYVRRSSHMQVDNFSLDAQKRGITEECQKRELPSLFFYEDDERSARTDQIAKRPAFKRLLEDVEAGRVQVVMVHSLDRWSRNMAVTIRSFQILAAHGVTFISLSEQTDYLTPEGKLHLTFLSGIAAYYSDNLSKHTSKGKGERAMQGLFNGDTPFGYRSAGSKLPPEKDPDDNPGLRTIGELRMRGMEGEVIADTINAEGYRTGSKRFGQRLFTKDTINAMLRNEFYAAYAPGDDRGTILYKGERYRGQHLATFTYEEWQHIRAVTQSMHHAARRAEGARRIYEFAGYIADIQCGLPLRCTGGGSRNVSHEYYRDVARTRRLPCPAGGHLTVRVDLVRAHFGDVLKSLILPEQWRDIIRRKMVEAAEATGLNRESIKRDKERLMQKRARILLQHREGYIDDEEMRGELAAVELTLRGLDSPNVNGVKLDEVIAAGERLPGMAALWDMATSQERREMVTLLLEPGGLYYDLELKTIAALKPRPAFLPVLRMLVDVVEYDEAKGLLVQKNWQERNAHPSVPFQLHTVDR